MVKTLGSFQQQVQQEGALEKKLWAAELAVQKGARRGKEDSTYFVPDHLAFDHDQGVEIIGITVSDLRSYVVVRCQ